ncbi:MAG: SOS response-associated peptidase [Ignavibacteria bacterium]
MCSRFENKETGESMFSKFEKDFLMLNIAAKDLKQINIAPNDDILVIHKNDNEFAIKNFSWGIKFPGDNTPLIFNSRIETIASKPYWKNIFKRNRCIIPATAFYEWKMMEGNKIPHRISFDSMPLFFIAGIYVKINDGIFASMITTTPNTTIAKIHTRMPVILSKEDGLNFLSNDMEEVLLQCKPLDNDISTKISIADDILTQKQKEFLEKGK